MSCRRIQVFGKVQGVFFRATTKTMADDLKLAGWVRNEPDGTVMIEVEGSKDKIEQMIGWCKQGPPFSRVDEVLHETLESKGHKDFKILH